MAAKSVSLLFLCLLVNIGYYVSAQTNLMYISGVIRDQAPNTMATCTPQGSAGTANGTHGFYGTDFEMPLNSYTNDEKGLMGAQCGSNNGWGTTSPCGQLGADGTPQYAYGNNPSPGNNIHSAASFYNWFHNTDENIPYTLSIPLQFDSSSNLYTYVNTSFFPLDNIGWTDHCNYHNYAFCFMAHTSFGYQGNEVFSFTGDDDMWAYINGELVIDLGSLHTSLSASIELDTIPGLISPNNYYLDFFYCERHTVYSDITVTTSLTFQCNFNDWCGVCNGNGQSCCTSAILNTTCNDHNACTTDTCGVTSAPGTSGGCVHTPISCPAAADLCHVVTCNNATGACGTAAIVCNDNNECTSDTCNPQSGCQYTTIPCNAGNQCKSQTCNPLTGCPAANISCDDNNPCTIDSCQSTSGCQHTQVVCNDNNMCTTDSCSLTTGKCEFVNITCNDNNACTADSCIPSSGCSFQTIDCNLGDQCMNYNCNTTIGCQQTPVICTANSPLCNCVNGACQNSTTCNDNNPCTNDACDSGDASGCSHINKTCDDGNACTVDSCDITTGACQFIPIVCNLTDLCTPWTCQAGVCVEAPVNCSDGNLCTEDVCTVVSGTPTCSNPSVTCPGDVCHPETCNVATGVCSAQPLLVCNDGNACTVDTWVCTPTGQNCTFTPLSCNDQNNCTIDMCNTSAPSNAEACYYPDVVCAAANICSINTGCDKNLGCQFAPKNCTTNVTNNYCNPASCDTLAGCINIARTCPNEDVGCFVSSCVPNNSTAGGACVQSQRSNFASSTGKGGVLCSILYGAGEEALLISTGAAVGIAVGGAAFAAIAGFGGKKGYEYLMNKNSPIGQVDNNPLYEHSGGAGQNALYRS